MSKKIAFTLAEVLVTMTLVGVVAALTIPTMHYSKSKKEYSAKIKNFYSRMNNAVLDMELDKGSFRNMAKPTSGYDWYMENIDPYYGHQFIKEAGRDGVSSNPEIFFKDGSSMHIDDTDNNCLEVLYDVNSLKSPNRPGFDIHSFLYCFDNEAREEWFGNKDIFFGTYGSEVTSSSTTRSSLLEKCEGVTEGSSASYCTRLLQYDQWEFKEDYPHKL